MKPEISNILFLDIETVPAEQYFSNLSTRMQGLWKKKAGYWLRGEGLSEELWSKTYNDKAAIYAEFGKIVCVSMGYFIPKSTGEWEFKMKSIYGENEAELLNEIQEIFLLHYIDVTKYKICGHNIQEFDIPYLCRRMLIHGIILPTMFNIYGKRPWELKYLLDTMNMWKFGDYKNYTSLDLLAAVFNIDSPKENLDGSKVGEYYYAGKLEEIVKYCEKDVLTTVKIYLRLLNFDFDFTVNVVTNK